jgi:hypothetical protein
MSNRATQRKCQKFVRDLAYKMNVEWIANAIRHLNGIYHYISKDSECYARRMIDRLTSRSIQIQKQSLSGEMVSKFRDLTILVGIVGP